MPPYKPSNALYFQPNERAENCFIVSNITKLSKGLFLVRLFLVTSITIKSTKRKNTVAYFLPLFRIYKYETPFILINVCSKFKKKQQNTTPHFSFLFYIKTTFSFLILIIVNVSISPHDLSCKTHIHICKYVTYTLQQL